jgi:hypothetical protein
MFSKIFAFLILAICTVGFSCAAVPVFAQDSSDAYQAGYKRGYQHGYQHGYEDAVRGERYENSAESRGSEAHGPYGEGMRRGERAGYDAGFRAGSGRHHHHHHHPDEDEGDRGY